MIDEDSLNNIERLHKLKAEGVISEADFEDAKRKLLDGGTLKQPQKVKIPVATTPPEQNEHFAWMVRPLKRYAEFSGRSSRKEFWMFLLFTNLASFAILVLGIGIGSDLMLGLWALFFLGVLVPFIAVQVRRFHDQGKSGWYAALNLIPYIGGLIVLGFMLVPGQQGDNAFGSDPYG